MNEKDLYKNFRPKRTKQAAQEAREKLSYLLAGKPYISENEMLRIVHEEENGPPAEIKTVPDEKMNFTNPRQLLDFIGESVKGWIWEIDLIRRFSPENQKESARSFLNVIDHMESIFAWEFSKFEGKIIPQQSKEFEAYGHHIKALKKNLSEIVTPN